MSTEANAGIMTDKLLEAVDCDTINKDRVSTEETSSEGGRTICLKTSGRASWLFLRLNAFRPQRDLSLPPMRVQCGRSIGTDEAKICDHIEVEDPLTQPVDNIMLF